MDEFYEESEGNVEDTCHPERYNEIMEAFKFFDQNGDGEIQMEEIFDMHYASTGQHIARKDMLEIFKEVDKDGSGTIDKDEFYEAVIERMMDVDLKEEVTEAFKVRFLLMCSGIWSRL